MQIIWHDCQILQFSKSGIDYILEALQKILRQNHTVRWDRGCVEERNGRQDEN